MPFMAIIAQNNNCGIQRAMNGHEVRGLFVSRVVCSTSRHFYIVVGHKLVRVQIVTTGPGKNKIAEKTEHEKVAGFGMRVVINIRRIINESAWLLRCELRIHVVF